MKNEKQVIIDEDPPVTKEETMIWLDAELAETVLLIDQQLPDGEGLKYLEERTLKFVEMLKHGFRPELEEIWMRRS
jgi:hypothetical protein